MVKVILTLFLVFTIGDSFSQFSIRPNSQTPTHNGDGSTDITDPMYRDGNGTLGMTYSQTLCGLNYAQASVMTTTRYTGSPGVGLPVSLTISTLPACAVVQQAYLYWIASTSSSDPGYTINGNPGTGTLIGTGPDKCWSLGGTNHFRASVTGTVTGNGTYTANVNSGPSATDGVTLIVIYTDPTATYRGTLILHDGCIVNTSGGATSYTMNGINACGAGTNTSGFLVTGDQQNNVAANHNITVGGTTGTFPNSFYNFDAVAPPVTSGLASMTFTNTPAGGDCYSIILAGLYFRTTTCGSCTSSSALTLNMSQTPENCGQCDGTATVAASGGSGTYTYTWSPAPGGGQGTATATGLCPGTYTVTVSDGGCNTSSNTVTVTSVGSPSSSTITPAGPFCQSSAATNLTAASPGGTWSGPGITNATNGTFDPSSAGPGSHTITYTIPNPCGSSSTTTIVVNATPTVNVPANITVCNGANVTASAYTSNPAGGTFTWTNSNTAIGLAASGTGNTPAFNATNSTGAPISSTVTVTPTVNGCLGTPSNYTITVNPTPTVTVPGNSSVCPGDLVAASNFVSTPAGGTFTWTNTNTGIGLGASGTGNTPAFTATNSTGSSITGTISVTPTANGCLGTPSSYTITVNDLFDATISPAGPFCESSASVNLTAVDPGGTWSGTGITNATNGTFDPVTAGPGTHTVTYTIPGSCGATDTENITVNPDLDATITPAGPFCTSDPALSLTAVDGGGVWSGTGITNTSLGIFDPSIAGAGTWTITYTISSMCGDTQTTDIIVNDQLDATITPVANVCEQDASFNLTAVDAGGTWSGTGITDAVNGTFDPATAGAGSHTVTYTLGGNCGDVQTTTVTVLQNMDATITPAGPFCTGNTAVNLSAVDGGGTWSGTGITDPANGTFDPAIAGVGVHSITYTIAGQCGDADNISITVVPNFSAAITQVGPFCQDAAAVTLSAVDPGGTWSGTGITDPVNGVFNPATAGPGIHTITYTIAGACGDAQSIDIEVNPIPVPSFSADVISGCAPLAVNFTDNTVPAGSSAIWSASDGFSSITSGTVGHTFVNPGSYNVTLTLTSAQGCTGTTIINNMISVFSNPIADFSWGPTDATVVNPTINFTNESVGATIYNWDFAGLGSSSATNPSFNFPNDSPNSYLVCLTAETVNGCIDSTCQLIEIHDEFLIFVPNSFTPDDDGINDVFKAVVSGHDPLTFEFLIFNRWGELIFNSQNDAVGWEGTYKGIKSQEDVYVWKIKVKQLSNGQLREYIGHVTLLR